MGISVDGFLLLFYKGSAKFILNSAWGQAGTFHMLNG